MVKQITWLERQFTFGQPKGMFPFFLERLDGTAARLMEKVRDHSEDILSHKLDGKWSVKENVAHLAEVGKISDVRVDEIKSGALMMSPAMLPLTKDYNSKTIGEVLEIFRQGRKKSVAHYQHLQEADLERTSVHPRLGVAMTAVDLAWFDAEHDDHHLVRINEILRGLKKNKL